MASDRDQSRPLTQAVYESVPSSRQTVKFITAATIGASLLLLSGLTMTGTVLLLILASPALVLSSPVIVPAVAALLLAGAGFLFSGGCGVAAAAALTWTYRYATGRHPIGADQLDYAREKIMDKARVMKEMAKECGQQVQHVAQDATQTQGS